MYTVIPLLVSPPLSFSLSLSLSLSLTPSPPSHTIRNASIHHTVLSSFLSMPKRFLVHQQKLYPQSQKNARYTSLVVRNLLTTIIIVFSLTLHRLHSRERWRQTLQHVCCVLPHWNHDWQIQKSLQNIIINYLCNQMCCRSFIHADSFGQHLYS